MSTNKVNPQNASTEYFKDTSIGATIARYKKIIQDLLQIQQTDPNAHVNTYMVYDHGQITPLLLYKNDVVTSTDASDSYSNKNTYLDNDIVQTPYELGSLIFVPVKKEEDYQISYHNGQVISENDD